MMTGESKRFIAVRVSRPNPFQLKTDSVIIAPFQEVIKLRARVVTIGGSAGLRI